MNKIMILLFIISLCSVSFAEFDKKIQVTGTAQQELLPDKASLTLVIRTDADSSDKASQENARILDKYKSILAKLNTKYDKIESVTYSSNKYNTGEYKTIDADKKNYTTTLDININIDSQNNVRKIADILQKYNVPSFYIKNISVSKTMYTFNIISEPNEKSDISYKNVLDKYNSIEKDLRAVGITNTDLKVSKYNVSEKSLARSEYVPIEKHSVSHSVKLTTKDIKSLGKIITTAQLLGINTNSYIEYDVTDKVAIEKKLYENAYTEAKKKADKILKNTDLSLKKPFTITDNSRFKLQPYYEYFYNYVTPIVYEKRLETSDADIVKQVNNINLIIAPKKINPSKTVDIEFEMSKK